MAAGRMNVAQEKEWLQRLEGVRGTAPPLEQFEGLRVGGNAAWLVDVDDGAAGGPGG